MTPAVANRYGAIEAVLHKTPQEFQFFQAVRLLERLYPNRAPVGRFVSPSKEVVRFSAHASFPFPASQIQNIDWADGTAAPSIMINFMGLTGPSGVLPLYYTELIVERLRQKDRSMLTFFDIFNHRMVSLFYQGWEKYRFAIAYERGERDRFSHHLMDLIGIGTKRLENRLAVRDDSLLFYAGLLSMHTRSAAALERILADYFEIPVEVEQFVGAWQGLRESDLCRFDRGLGVSEQLGGGAIVGDEIWNQQAGVRVKLGPLGLTQYLDFLPTGTAYDAVRSLAKFISRGEIDFEIQLILKKEEVPACELGVEDSVAPRLGWTSWAKTKPLGRDADDTILRG
ncbi:MAG: type VI secretion system baseplate subunit TssG [Acidobacteriota bacterium]|nr:type VI secretion system baseplate subunit TssG [Acidobacteriota bacterium]